MENINNYIQDLEILFEMDLLNKFEKLDNSVVVTMEDGSKVKVLVKHIA